MHLFRAHKWTSWYDLDTCHQERRCTMEGCTKKETKDTHTMTEWSYVSNHECIQECHCTKCSHSKTRIVEHDFSEWNYYIKDCCTQRRICKRCGFIEYREKCIKGEEKYTQIMGQCAVVSQCPQCGEKTFSSIEHRWVKDIATYSDCLRYRLNRYKQRLSNESHEIELLENIQETDTLEYYEHIEARNKLQQNIARDTCLIKNSALELYGANICEKCLFIKPFGIRDQKMEIEKKSVFISYSHNYNVDQVRILAHELEKRGIGVTIDENNLRIGDDISQFAESVREHDFILCVLSSPYIESIWCMSEAVSFMKEINFRERMLPILGDPSCCKDEKSREYSMWWNEAIRNRRYEAVPEREKKCREIGVALETFLKHIVNTNAPLITDYDSICHWVNRKIN